MQFKVIKTLGKKNNIDKISYVQASNMAEAVMIAAKMPGTLVYIKQISHDEYIKGKLRH